MGNHLEALRFAEIKLNKINLNRCHLNHYVYDRLWSIVSNICIRQKIRIVLDMIWYHSKVLIVCLGGDNEW